MTVREGDVSVQEYASRCANSVASGNAGLGVVAILGSLDGGLREWSCKGTKGDGNREC